MFRFTKALALAAVAASGMLLATAAQASANSIVDFRVHNVDTSNSMKLAADPGSAFSGYLPLGTEIKPNGYDPSSTAYIVQSGALPTINGANVTNKIMYTDFLSSSYPCTFSIIVTKVIGGYQLSFSVDHPAQCTVPSATPTSATADFSGTVYGLTWHE